MNRRNTRILLSTLSGLLQALIFPNASWTWLSWVALVPLLYALLARPSVQIISRLEDDASAGVLTQAQGFWIGYASGIVWYACSCYWVYRVMHLYGGLSSPVAALMLLLFCMYLGLYHGLFGALVVRCSARRLFPGTRALILAPILWVAVELARARVTGFPWDLLGTAQVDNVFWVPLIATKTGGYGLSFLIAAINAMFVGVILSRGKSRIVIAAAAVLAVGSFEAGKAVSIAPSVSTHVAVLVQQNIPLDLQWTPQIYDTTMAKLADETRQAARRDDPAPRVIVWPESPSPFYLNDPKFRNWMSTLAADRDAFIVAGSLGVRNTSAQDTEGETFNSAALIAPSGAFVSRYDKVHLVPFGEYVPFKALLFFAKNLTKEVGTFSAGNDRSIFKLSQDRATESIGPFICYESVFPDEIREFAANGAQVFVNISNDGWFGTTGAARQHLNMARMRAIENQRWVLRSTNTGITASIDPYGRVVVAAEPNIQTSLRAPYALVSEMTFYTRHGDWFAIACAIISVMVLFVRFSFRAGVIRGN